MHTLGLQTSLFATPENMAWLAVPLVTFITLKTAQRDSDTPGAHVSRTTVGCNPRPLQFQLILAGCLAKRSGGVFAPGGSRGVRLRLCVGNTGQRIFPQIDIAFDVQEDQRCMFG